jgi:hypothetical protein
MNIVKKYSLDEDGFIDTSRNIPPFRYVERIKVIMIYGNINRYVIDVINGLSNLFESKLIIIFKIYGKNYEITVDVADNMNDILMLHKTICDDVTKYCFTANESAMYYETIAINNGFTHVTNSILINTIVFYDLSQSRYLGGDISSSAVIMLYSVGDANYSTYYSIDTRSIIIDDTYDTSVNNQNTQDFIDSIEFNIYIDDTIDPKYDYRCNKLGYKLDDLTKFDKRYYCKYLDIQEYLLKESQRMVDHINSLDFDPNEFYKKYVYDEFENNMNIGRKRIVYEKNNNIDHPYYRDMRKLYRFVKNIKGAICDYDTMEYPIIIVEKYRKIFKGIDQCIMMFSMRTNNISSILEQTIKNHKNSVRTFDKIKYRDKAITLVVDNKFIVTDNVHKLNICNTSMYSGFIEHKDSCIRHEGVMYPIAPMHKDSKLDKVLYAHNVDFMKGLYIVYINIAYNYNSNKYTKRELDILKNTKYITKINLDDINGIHNLRISNGNSIGRKLPDFDTIINDIDGLCEYYISHCSAPVYCDFDHVRENIMRYMYNGLCELSICGVVNKRLLSYMCKHIIDYGIVPECIVLTKNNELNYYCPFSMQKTNKDGGYAYPTHNNKNGVECTYNGVISRNIYNELFDTTKCPICYKNINRSDLYEVKGKICKTSDNTNNSNDINDNISEYELETESDTESDTMSDTESDTMSDDESNSNNELVTLPYYSVDINDWNMSCSSVPYTGVYKILHYDNFIQHVFINTIIVHAKISLSKLPSPRHFKYLFEKCCKFSSLLNENIVVYGEACSNTLYYAQSNGTRYYNIGFINMTHDKILETIPTLTENILDTILSENNNDIRIGCMYDVDNGTIDISVKRKNNDYENKFLTRDEYYATDGECIITLKYMIRENSNYEDLFSKVSINSSQILFNGNELHMSQKACYAYKYNMNIVDIDVYDDVTERELLSSLLNGFSLVFPYHTFDTDVSQLYINPNHIILGKYRIICFNDKYKNTYENIARGSHVFEVHDIKNNVGTRYKLYRLHSDIAIKIFTHPKNLIIFGTYRTIKKSIGKYIREYITSHDK